MQSHHTFGRGIFSIGKGQSPQYIGAWGRSTQVAEFAPLYFAVQIVPRFGLCKNPTETSSEAAIFLLYFNELAVAHYFIKITFFTVYISKKPFYLVNSKNYSLKINLNGSLTSRCISKFLMI